MRGRYSLGVGFCAMVAVVLASQSAQAQTAAVRAAPDDTTASNELGGAALGEIVVTAQRKSENLQDVPIAIAASTGEQLQDAHITNMADVALLSPGLVVSQNAGYAMTFIRGIGTTTSNPGLETSVATYVDDIYVPQQIGSLFDLVDVENVQVLKGPQGSLYGRNATGGAFLINTANPTDKLEGYIRGEYGNLDHVETTGVLNLPAGDALRFRFAGRYYDDGGYVRNLNTGKDMMGGEGYLLRGKMEATPTDRLTINVTGEYSHRDEDINVHKNILPAPFCVACAIYGNTTITPTKTYLTDEDAVPSTVTKVGLITAKIDYELGKVKLSSITGYRDQNWEGVYDIDASVGVFQHFHAKQVVKSFQQEERFATSFDGPLNFLGGFVYSRYDGRWPRLNIFGDALGGPVGISAVNKVISNSYSVYGEAYYDLTDRLKLTAGGRYTKERKTLDGTSSFVAAIDSKVSYSAFTPRVVVAYDTDLGNIYVTYNQGFKSGGINTPAFAPPDVVKPEKIKSVEGGAKLDFLDRRLRVNLSAFHYWYDDLQVTFTDISNGGQNTQNAAGAKVDGVEVGFEAAVTSGLRIGGEVDYLRGRYKDYPFAAILEPAALGFTPSVDPAITNLSGSRMRQAPKWTITGHIDYDMILPNGMDAGVSLNGRYTSSYDFFAGGGSTLGLDRQSAFFIANASAYINLTSQVKLGAFVNNLTDRYYVLDRETYATGAFEVPARPRTYGASITYSF